MTIVVSIQPETKDGRSSRSCYLRISSDGENEEGIRLRPSGWLTMADPGWLSFPDPGGSL